MAYDFRLEYTLGKGNKVVDALSRKHQNRVLAMIEGWKALEMLASCGVHYRWNAGLSRDPNVLASLEVHPTLVHKISERKNEDPLIVERMR